MKDNFYVYCLRRPDKSDPLYPDLDQPFYIGKGKGKRIKQHRIEAKVYQDGNLDYKNPKNSVIVSLWNKGLDFQEEIILDKLTEQQAMDIEKDIVKTYGRKANKTGILANLSEGGERGPVGYNHSKEHKEKNENTNGWKSFFR